MSKFIKRITLFKVAKDEDVQAILNQYEVLRRTAVKDGKPYVLSNEANRVVNTSEPRSQGFTIAVQSTFASMEDLKYYDIECAAHKELKGVVGGNREGVCTLIFESDMGPGK